MCDWCAFKESVKILQVVIKNFKAFQNITSQAFTLLQNKAKFKQKNKFALPLPITKMPGISSWSKRQRNGNKNKEI